MDFGEEIPYYFAKIIALYIIILTFWRLLFLLENKLYLSYMEISCDIFKEFGKYLSVFIWPISLYYLFSKYIKEDDYDLSKDSNQKTV